MIMTADDVAAISVPVLGLAQLTKWLIQRGDPRGAEWLGPLSIFFYAALAVSLWVYSHVWPPHRMMLFDIFANWVVVTLTAAGVYGFTRKLDEPTYGRRETKSDDDEMPSEKV